MNTKAAANSFSGEPKPTERLTSEETFRLGREILRTRHSPPGRSRPRRQDCRDRRGKRKLGHGPRNYGREREPAGETPGGSQRPVRARRLPDGRQHGGRAPAENRLIEGAVNSWRQAVITLSIHGPTGRTREVDAVIDTGYSEYLTLPPTIVRQLALPFAGKGRAYLADGSEVFFDLYQATVLWDSQPMPLDAYESNSIPLVGMALLRGHNLSIDVERGGRVAIQANQ